jgi:SAM-dependent methyltransferase
MSQVINDGEAGRARAAKRGIERADAIFATPTMLAQASSPAVATFHASLFKNAHTILDLGCGMGMDTAAFARAGLNVIAIERDPERLACAEKNIALWGLERQVTFILADAEDWVQTEGIAKYAGNAIFLDPARRDSSTGARFSRHADQYEPSLTFAQDLLPHFPTIILKLSPLLPDDVLSALGNVTFLSEDRSCKEACVTLLPPDALRNTPAAHLLPENITVAHTESLSAPTPLIPGGYLLDPDPAIIRAGVLETAATNLGATRIATTDAYLYAPALPNISLTRLASAWRVQHILPFKPALVSDWLRKNNIGRLTVKKRYYPKEPGEVCKELKMKQIGEEATLVIVRQERGWLAVICDKPTVL